MSFDPDSLVRIPGGARMTSPDVVTLAAGEQGLYLARPQVVFRPDTALVYGPKGARVRMLNVKFREEERQELTPADVLEPAPRRSLAGACLDRFEKVTIEPAGFLELQLQNDSDRRVAFSPVFLGVMHDGAHPQKTAIGALRTVDHLQGSRSFTVPGARPADPLRSVLAIETLLRWETNVRALEITTDAEPGDLWVYDFKMGKDSQLPSPSPWPVELFASPLPLDTDRGFPGVVVTLAICNRAPEPRAFSFTIYVEPPKSAEEISDALRRSHRGTLPS